MGYSYISISFWDNASMKLLLPMSFVTSALLTVSMIAFMTLSSFSYEVGNRRLHDAILSRHRWRCCTREIGFCGFHVTGGCCGWFAIFLSFCHAR